MKRLIIFLLAFVLVVSFSGGVFGFIEPPYIPVAKPTPTNTVTVCSSGCDYATIELADQAAQPGWLIQIREGTYPGIIEWDSSGTAGNEIVIEPHPDNTQPVTIVNSGASTTLNVRSSYIIFDGGPNRNIVIEGSAGIDDHYMVRLVSGGGHNTFSRIHMKDARSAARTSKCMVPEVNDIKIYNSICEGSDSVGIYVGGGNNTEIRNNIVRNNEGTGVQVNPHSGATSDEIVISGNAIYGNGLTGDMGVRPGIAILSNDNDLYDVYVYNNLLWNNTDAGIKVAPDNNINVRIYYNTVYNNIDHGMWLKTGPTYTTRNNIVFGNSLDYPPWNWVIPVGPSVYDIVTDPSFLSTDPSSNDFLKLSPSSTNVIDQGIDVGITDDYFGTSRPQPLGGAYDIGAYEYIQTGTTCSPADSPPEDGVVSITELINYISQWKLGNVLIGELITAIGEWKNGCS